MPTAKACIWRLIRSGHAVIRAHTQHHPSRLSTTRISALCAGRQSHQHKQPPPKKASPHRPPAPRRARTLSNNARSYSEGPPFEGHKGPGRRVGPLNWESGVEGQAGGGSGKGKGAGRVVSAVSVRPREPPCLNIELKHSALPLRRTHASTQACVPKLARSRSHTHFAVSHHVMELLFQ